MIKSRLIKKEIDWKSLRGDISGASAAAVITIPLVIAYGLIAFAPLGPGFASKAALIGILSAFFTCSVASLLGGTPVLITAPTAALTLLMSSVVGFLATSPFISVPSRELVIICLMSLTVLTAGIVQVVFSIFRLGNLVKYVPYPVMAGFMNGVAILLILKQLRPFLGVKSKTPILQIGLNPEIIEPLTFLVGFFSLLTIFYAERRFKSIPSSFAGLVSGTALYYGILFLFDPTRIGPTIGRLDLKITGPLAFRDTLGQIPWPYLTPLLPTLLLAGILVGLVASMESLLSSVRAEDLTGSRHKSNRELLGQGIGNTVSALFGCLPGAGSIAETLDNYRAGGRTRFSSFLTPVFIILITGLLGSLIGIIPLTVFAAVVIATAFEMVDRWSVHLLRQLPKADRHRRNILANLGVTLVVTIVMVSFNLIMAVGIGIIIASVLFITKMGKSSVRRKYLGNQVRSKKVRNQEESSILDRLSQKIVVFELQGPIFFGSGDNLVREVHESMKEGQCCILDMKRVNEIDSTGAKSIVRASRALDKENKKLLISYLQEGGPLREFLAVLKFEQEFGRDRIFPDTDAALERAENDLLQSEGVRGDTGEMEFHRMDIWKEFTEDEIKLLEKEMFRAEFCCEEKAIDTFEQSRDLFFLTKGSVSIRIPLREGGQNKRLATYPAGTVFGEMAFLDGAPRSAEVVCDEESVIYILPYEKFESFSREKPDLALKLIKSIAVEVSRRLRTTSLEVAFLEEH